MSLSLNSEYWQKRVDNIKKNVSIRSVIDYFKVPCQSHGIITQVHCPFHGNDSHASARIYETNTMYCFFCNKTWDVISFIKDMKNISFAESCTFLEEAYSLPKIDRIEIAQRRESLEDYLKNKLNEKNKKEKDFNEEFSKISKYLIRNKDFFSLEEYAKYFDFFDSLFYKYKSDSYSNDEELQVFLTGFHKEISKKV